MPLSKRKCLKHDEDLKLYPDVKLEVFKNYSRKACLLECQARKIRDICHCLPYYYPDFSRLWGMKTDCDLKGLQCLSNITSEQIRNSILVDFLKLVPNFFEISIKCQCFSRLQEQLKDMPPAFPNWNSN